MITSERISRTSITVALLGIVTLSPAGDWKNEITSGTDKAWLTWNNKTKENMLEATVDGTSYTVDLRKEDLPAMHSFPIVLQYGERGNLVWVYSHNRGGNGSTLIDVVAGQAICGYNGNNAGVSPDGKRVAYSRDGHWGLFEWAGINDFMVYPVVGQWGTENADLSLPSGLPRDIVQMEMMTEMEWLDNDTVAFVHADNTRVADARMNPDLIKYWYVQIDGAGDSFTTDTICVWRALLNAKEGKRFTDPALNGNEKFDRTAWLKKTLAPACQARLQKVTAQSFPKDVLADLIPQGVIGKRFFSPDKKHRVAFGTLGFETDTDSYITVELDGEPVKINKLYRTSRLINEPHWLDNNTVEFIAQTGWVEEELLNQKGSTENWRISISAHDDGSSPTVVVRRTKTPEGQE